MKKRGKLVVGIIQLFVATGALPAGYSMISEPDGTGLGMTVEILSDSPFKDFFIPGLFLFIVNGLFNLAGSILCFFKYRYAYSLGIGLGAALIIWVSVQVCSIGLTHFLQPTYFIIGIIEIIFGILLFRSEKSEVK